MDATLTKINAVYAGADREKILKAYAYAEKAHENQKRASGEPYFIHPCAVAEILIDLGLDPATISAALLHDVIEDTETTEEDVRREFGEEVLGLVSGVTKLEKIVFKSKEAEDAENFRKMFVAMAKDIRVIIIKLADRLHNMRSLDFLSHERQQRLSTETLEVFAPLAGRLGISQIKCELEDLCLKYTDPEAYEFLTVNIRERLSERREFVQKIVAEIKELMDHDGVEGEVFGRPKHFFSIYKKMKNKDKSLDQIYDLTAVRVIVGDMKECYTVLGRIHEKWKPIPGRIKDYIATPKPNKYQSLHTTVMTEFGQPFEIQIRTEEMHRIAEFGIAAHWKYKEGKTEEASTNFENRLSWLREVMEWQGTVKDSTEFIDALKTELYSHELLVFTPRGKVISLPPGATPIDFAYAIHSEVGNRCTGARVNSKMVPLTSTLETGDVVEIITSPNSKGPSRDWLKFIKSSSAKAKIKQFYKNELKDENIRIGQLKLDDEAKKKGYTMSTLLTEESFKRLAERFSFGAVEEMYAAVGYGSISVGQILFKLIDYYKKEMPKAVEVHVGAGRNTGGVLINGQAGLLVRFAGCCSPVPGDKIVGFTTRGRGVVVHREDCKNVNGADKQRILPASWQIEAGARQRFNANISIRATDQGAALSVLSSVVSELKLSITAVNGRIDKNQDAVLEASISLTDVSEVDMLIKKLKIDKRIYDVHRITTLS
ncbi:MAG: bifunctional (p)ppGpp synthetase/guanosine-3',5'-bis(diphosphate) 3'-pyrophosphohydrolase [Clostridia bacterium]|nr:bifunctional (p)ppGpp synthetase/guanosine-3',5'-bis(diphosphate) 3'-pyrophosphohydrolase [Clostridia bacterium]